MARNRRSAKQAGSAFEKLIAEYLAAHVDDRIERRTRNGVNDRGDITGLKHLGERIVIECKNTARPNLGGWAEEAEIERGNDDATTAIIAHKRHGKGKAGDQWITMTLKDFVALIMGERPEEEDGEE